jgi:hypothetical protein
MMRCSLLDNGIKDPETGSLCFGGYLKMKRATIIAIAWIKDSIDDDPWNNISQQFHIINIVNKDRMSLSLQSIYTILNKTRKCASTIRLSSGIVQPPATFSMTAVRSSVCFFTTSLYSQQYKTFCFLKNSILNQSNRDF